MKTKILFAVGLFAASVWIGYTVHPTAVSAPATASAPAVVVANPIGARNSPDLTQKDQTLGRALFCAIVLNSVATGEELTPARAQIYANVAVEQLQNKWHYSEDRASDVVNFTNADYRDGLWGIKNCAEYLAAAEKIN